MNEKSKRFWPSFIIVALFVIVIIFNIICIYDSIAKFRIKQKADYRSSLDTLESDNRSIREQLEKQRNIIEFLDATNKQLANDNRRAIKNLESARGAIARLTADNKELASLNQKAAANFREALATLETIRGNQESNISAIGELRECNRIIADAIAGN